MTKFKKGVPRHKDAGRAKGTVNKKTEQWDKFNEWFMEEGIEKLRVAMEQLEGKELIKEMKDLLEYFKPKLARNEVTGKDGEDVVLKLIIDAEDKDFIEKL